MTLYLKYRPQTIEELDLTSVREGLKKIITAKELPHAFLFAGPKGTGKTSAARILAKILNCEKQGTTLGEPCNLCSQCVSITKGGSLDVIEMDAASNRGIDDVRSLREHVALAPTSGKSKLYIIDEAHMLTTEAANALLKTLEEPPTHAVFVLATTDPQKLPDTVQSRLVTVQFTKANPTEIVRQLARVIEGEKLDVEEGAVPLIAKASDGSFRDAVKILESLSMDQEKITREKAEEYLFQKKSAHPGGFLETISERDLIKSLNAIAELSRQGTQMKQFMDRLIESAREEMLQKATDQKGKTQLTQHELVQLLELLLEARINISKSPVAELPLELAMIEWHGVKDEQNKVAAVPQVSNDDKDEETIEVVVEEEAPSQKKTNGDFDNTTWMQILSEVRGKNTTVDALLRAAHPIAFDGKKLSIAVYYRFHKERLETNQNLHELEDICTNIIGSPVKLVFSLEERAQPVAVKPDLPLTQTKDHDILTAAKEIFGN